MKTLPIKKLKLNTLTSQSIPYIKLPQTKSFIEQNQNSLSNKRERAWNNRFIYNKIPYYDSLKDKNILCHKKFIKIMNLKKHDTFMSPRITKNIKLSKTCIGLINNSKNNIADTTKEQKSLFITNHPSIKMLTTKNKTSSKKSFNNFSPILSSENKKNGDKINVIPNKSTVHKLWEELGVQFPYRNYFNYISKELENQYKEKLYQKEIQELNTIKIKIRTLKFYINLRLGVIEEIKKLNEQLGDEIISKNNTNKENILSQLTDKIILLREETVNVCQSMKKLKESIFHINHLDKYNFEIIAKKFNFDKNYLIKMKTELNFLKEGFAKYYFNIEKEQTPFLLNASDNTKINKKDYFIRKVPLSTESENEIVDCLFYLYQELIAYQNYNFNKNNLRAISPMKRINKSSTKYNFGFKNRFEKKNIYDMLKIVNPQVNEGINDMNKKNISYVEESLKINI